MPELQAALSHTAELQEAESSGAVSSGTVSSGIESSGTESSGEVRSDAGLESVRDDLIVQYQEYVHCVVGTMIQSMGLPAQLFEEFVSAGYLGLVEAASRFDPNTGRDFKSFAFLRIRGSVIDSIRECADTSGKAYRYVKALHAMQNVRETSTEFGGHEPFRSNALARIFDFASKGVLAFRLSVIDAEDEIAKEIGSPSTPEQELSRSRNLQKLSDAIATLPEKERLVIEEYYFKDRSFTEIADGKEGLSKSWVSRLHSKAIEKLQEHFLVSDKSEEL